MVTYVQILSTSETTKQSVAMAGLPATGPEAGLIVIHTSFAMFHVKR